MDTQQKLERSKTLQELQNQVKEWHQKSLKSSDHGANEGAILCLAKTGANSNLTRSLTYKKDTRRLNVEGLDRVLEIDPVRQIALCEPRVSMYTLAKETIKAGFIPLVVPEFKGITVGGAINGCGGESSSHKVGLFNDICERYELLLGNGEIINASKDEHADLYYGIAGSYGSLAVLLSAEVKLQRAKPWVTLRYHHFDSAAKALAKMRALMHQKRPPEFLEGIVLSSSHAIIIEGEPQDVPEKRIFRPNALSPWFYQHAKSQQEPESMPLLDYIFRYDTGAFWMGSYVIYPPIAVRVFLEGVFKCKKATPFTQQDIADFSRIHDPGLIKRLLTSPVTSSQTLYGVLRKCEKWIADRFIVQDFTLPESSIEPFMDKAKELCPIYPLWLCPVKNSQSKQLFSPHVSQTDAFSINVGIYGLPNSKQPIFSILKQLEDQLAHFSGKKWLYTHSCYTPEEFWKIYPKDDYLQLRNKYAANNIFMSIDQKVLTK